MVAVVSHKLTREFVNTIYFLVPPLGLIFACLSPFFTAKERLVRGIITATFITFFSTMGPTLHHYYDAQLASLQNQQQP